MIVFINEKEAAALTLHMSIMRKSFRKLLKARYSSNKATYMQSYDYLLDEVKKALEGQYSAYALNMNIQDLEILHEFLRAYIDKVEKEMSKHLQDTDREQLYVLRNVQDKAYGSIIA